MFPIEGDRWLVTLPGFFDEPMPQDHNAFLAYARSLAVPDIYETIRNGEPLSEIKRFRFIGSLRRRYERLEHVPEGLIAMGDAVCSFNPVYGQGMTVGAIEAEALSRAVTEARVEGGIGPDFGRRWFQTIRPVVDAAWNGVRLEDFRFPELARERPLRLRPLQWYMERVLKHWRLTGRGEAFRAHVITYADDFVILSRGRAAEALAWTRAVMAKLGLMLNEAKTSVKDARRESFDFLGYTFGPQRYRKDGHWYLGASPSKRSVQRLKTKVGDLLVSGNKAPWPEVRAG